MKGILPRLGLAGAVCCVWATTLNGFAPQAVPAAPSSAPPPRPARLAGAQIFDKWCSDCHSTPGGPGTLALQRKYQGNLPAILEQRRDLQPDFIKGGGSKWGFVHALIPENGDQRRRFGARCGLPGAAAVKATASARAALKIASGRKRK